MMWPRSASMYGIECQVFIRASTNALFCLVNRLAYSSSFQGGLRRGRVCVFAHLGRTSKKCEASHLLFPHKMIFLEAELSNVSDFMPRYLPSEWEACFMYQACTFL